MTRESGLLLNTIPSTGKDGSRSEVGSAKASLGIACRSLCLPMPACSLGRPWPYGSLLPCSSCLCTQETPNSVRSITLSFAQQANTPDTIYNTKQAHAKVGLRGVTVGRSVSGDRSFLEGIFLPLHRFSASGASPIIAQIGQYSSLRSTWQ